MPTIPQRSRSHHYEALRLVDEHVSGGVAPSQHPFQQVGMVWEHMPNVWVPPTQSREQNMWLGRGARDSPFNCCLRDGRVQENIGTHSEMSSWTDRVRPCLLVGQTRHGCHLPTAFETGLEMRSSSSPRSNR
jgi:hypothetical protein